MRVVVVGGGVLGTMHAWHARRRGHQVTQVEREPAARGGSVRNFGLIWVGGRAEGAELDAAVRGRELWSQIAALVPGIGFRPAGSITVARNPAELAVAQAAIELDSAKERGYQLLDADRVRQENPALRGDLLGGLWCREDAVVEPRLTQAALRKHLLSQPSYAWRPGREVRAIEAGQVRDDHGDRYDADVVIVCPGAALAGLTRDLAGAVPVRRVRLQMMQTDPLGEPLPTAVADGDSFRYYPAYRGAALDALQASHPQQPIARAAGMQLLMVQRADGGLTIGDTHAYDEPFDFDVSEAPYEYLAGVAEALLGRPLPPIRRRWAGVYAQTHDPEKVVHRQQVAPGVWLVLGPGGRGMTCSPAIAQQTTVEAGL